MLLATGLLLAGGFGALYYITVPAFGEAFASWGPTLPAATGVLLRFYPALLLLPVLVFVVWLFWPNRRQRGIAALITGGAIFLVGHALLITVLYLPVFQLGK
jgi:hypothetical protein